MHFIDEQTLSKIHAGLDCTVIRATHRTCDLIPAFLHVLSGTAEYTQIMSSPIKPFCSANEQSEYWDSEDATYFLDSLFDTLNQYAPEGYYFGAHPGDGSDYGFWSNEFNN